MVVLVEELEKTLKHVGDILVDPRSVLQLDHNVEGVDHGKVFETLFVAFQVLEG